MLRYSLLTAGLMLGASAFAAPAGDLPLMPWPAKVERPTTQGALELNNQLTVSVSGDDLGAENTSIPWVTIEDSPRFPWRGLLLDSARHFLPIPDIKRQIDGMAAAKLNVLHWHLTDDQGWRFSSKRYPKLTQLASDGLFYTPEQMREIVRYAAGN